MDLAIYISELLGQRGELKIPGVGYFTQMRTEGYYNDQEYTFYPPAYKISFDPDIADDDNALAEYIVSKKNISMLSAKYFVDKYLGTLKQDVLHHDVELADLGQLSTENSRLLFKPGKAANEANGDFFGFSPLKLYAKNQEATVTYPPVTEDAPPTVIAEEETYYAPPPVAVPEEVSEEVLTDQPVSKPQVFSPQEKDEQELLHIEEEIRKPNLPVIILFAITIAGLIFFGIYLYNPGLFGSKPDTNAVIKPVDNPKPKPVIATQDTVKEAPPVILPQPVTTTVDTMGKRHYELMAGAFKTTAQINVAVKNYQGLGLKPRILQHATGRLYKITLGTYFSQSEAIKAQDSIAKATKIRKSNILIQPINPKK